MCRRCFNPKNKHKPEAVGQRWGAENIGLIMPPKNAHVVKLSFMYEPTHRLRFVQVVLNSKKIGG